MDLKEAEIFLKEAKQIYSRIPKKEKTFMEISGYPHYENVCSNILSFYLNPKEEHNLEEIVLRTLLETAKERNKDIQINVNLSNMNVFREYTTESGNRIDIVLQSDEMVIGIENKIMAGVYNDLMDYSNTLEKMNSNVVKILLSLHSECNVAEQNQFINITYHEFFKKLKTNLENIMDRQNKWHIYLIDFINNLEGVKVEKEMEENINEWIKKNQEDINEFYELLKVAKNNMKNKINEYGTLLEEVSPGYKVKYWQESDVQVGAYILLDSGCNLDAVLTVDGWKLGINLWRKSIQIKVKQALCQNGYDIIEEMNGHIYLYQLEYESPINKVVEKAKGLLNLLQKMNETR